MNTESVPDPSQAGQSLVILCGDQLCGEQPLASDVMRIGREPANELVLEDAQVSRFHARIVRDGCEWWVEDLGSSNGVFVDGERTERARLHHGWKLDIGQHRLIWRDPAERDSASGDEGLPEKFTAQSWEREAASLTAENAIRQPAAPKIMGMPSPDSEIGLEEKTEEAQLRSSEAEPQATNPPGKEDPEELILVVEASGERMVFRRPAVRIGRDEEADLRLAHESVSRDHLVIIRRPLCFSTQDLRSTNGTWINGNRVDHGTLRSGDELRVGEVRLLVERAAERRPAPVRMQQDPEEAASPWRLRLVGAVAATAVAAGLVVLTIAIFRVLPPPAGELPISPAVGDSRPRAGIAAPVGSAGSQMAAASSQAGAGRTSLAMGGGANPRAAFTGAPPLELRPPGMAMAASDESRIQEVLDLYERGLTDEALALARLLSAAGEEPSPGVLPPAGATLLKTLETLQGLLRDAETALAQGAIDEAAGLWYAALRKERADIPVAHRSLEARLSDRLVELELRRAGEAMERGNLQVAATRLAAARRRDPENPEVASFQERLAAGLDALPASDPMSGSQEKAIRP
ncbi:MAG: FHA domain-containing protein [Candidatus Schekmanbacteria bacterium]|nr:FHA domain-containing protein [Candidatus Schekmanbacteria bacterium]